MFLCRVPERLAVRPAASHDDGDRANWRAHGRHAAEERDPLDDHSAQGVQLWR